MSFDCGMVLCYAHSMPEFLAASWPMAKLTVLTLLFLFLEYMLFLYSVSCSFCLI